MDPLRQIRYHTAKEIYDQNTQARKSQPVLNQQHNNPTNVKWNIFVRFLDLKNHNHTIPLMICDDFSMECHVIIQASPEIIKDYGSYLQPWYIFRFEQLKVTAINSKTEDHPKRVWLIGMDPERMVVFNLIKDVEPDRFFFTKSTNPVITGFDWQTIGKMQDEFNLRIRRTEIKNFKHLYETRPNRADPRLVSFVAQIVEIKQVPDKIIAEVWDSTKPSFEVKLPITQVQMDTRESLLKHGQKDDSLKLRASGRTINVLVIGDELVAKFNGKKPKDMVLFHNAKLYETDTQPKIFRIEVSRDKIRHPERALVLFLGDKTPLGRSLKSKIDPHAQFDSYEEQSATANLANGASSLITYDETEQRNQIVSISDFSRIDNLPPGTYQIKCYILDLYPTEYKITDLIMMKCSNKECRLKDKITTLDHTISHLSPVDLAGLRSAAPFLLIKHGRNSSKMQCPVCEKDTCSFYFQVIFILRDKTGVDDPAHYMFACLENDYAQRFFEMYPIEVIANQRDEEHFFLSKIKYLKERFKGSNDCYMIVEKDNDGHNYNIRDIRIA